MNGDPVSTDAPPRAGSMRYLAIKERAMSATTEPVRHAAPRRFGPPVAVAAIIVLALVLASARTGEPASAAEAVTAAARGMGGVTSLRAIVRYDDGRRVARASAHGTDVEVREGRSIHAVVDGKLYEKDPDGAVHITQARPDTRPAPFAEASQAVVLAALRGSGVTKIGDETVRGQSTTHYRIAVSAAAQRRLRKLSPSVLGWFELENPNGTSRIDVWVEDELIRRIQVVQRYGPTDPPVRSTTEFFDFGADVQIRPPRP